jgi:predicted kinase
LCIGFPGQGYRNQYYMIVIVFGLPGSGKSYFAAHLADLINADYVNSDQLRKKMFSKRSYSDTEKAAVYDEMLKEMKKAVGEGRNIVLDATFYKRRIRDKFEQNRKVRGNIYFIEVVAREKLTRERLALTRADSEADFGVYKLIHEEWEPMERPHLVLQSTNDNLDDMLQKADAYLRANNDKRAN